MPALLATALARRIAAAAALCVTVAGCELALGTSSLTERSGSDGGGPDATTNGEGGGEADAVGLDTGHVTEPEAGADGPSLESGADGGGPDGGSPDGGTTEPRGRFGARHRRVLAHRHSRHDGRRLRIEVRNRRGRLRDASRTVLVYRRGARSAHREPRRQDHRLRRQRRLPGEPLSTAGRHHPGWMADGGRQVESRVPHRRFGASSARSPCRHRQAAPRPSRPATPAPSTLDTLTIKARDDRAAERLALRRLCFRQRHASSRCSTSPSPLVTVAPAMRARLRRTGPTPRPRRLRPATTTARALPATVEPEASECPGAAGTAGVPFGDRLVPGNGGNGVPGGPGQDGTAGAGGYTTQRTRRPVAAASRRRRNAPVAVPTGCYCAYTYNYCPDTGYSGCGGQGAVGGGAGAGGGSSIGLYVWNAAVTIENISIAVGNGGSGGNGGGAGTAGAGERRRLYQPAWSIPSTSGARRRAPRTAVPWAPAACGPPTRARPEAKAGTAVSRGPGGGGAEGDSYCYVTGGTGTVMTAGGSCTPGTAGLGGNQGQSNQERPARQASTTERGPAAGGGAVVRRAE